MYERMYCILIPDKVEWRFRIKFPSILWIPKTVLFLFGSFFLSDGPGLPSMPVTSKVQNTSAAPKR